MSLVTTVYVPEGIVISADSRVLININSKKSDIVERNAFVLSDTIKKIKIIDNKYIIAAYGQISLKNLPIIEHLEAFEAEYLTPEIKISDLPEKMIEYFTKNFGEVSTVFYLAGYEYENKIPVPYVYLVDIRQKIVNRLNITEENINFGANWGGETEILTRLFSTIQVKGRGEEWKIMDRGTIHYEFMSLEDAIIYSRFLIDVSEKMFNYQLKQQSVGGKIVTAVLPKNDIPFYIEEEI